MRKISPNAILLYEACPRKWFLLQGVKKERKQLLAFYRFSSALHHAARKYTTEDSDPIEVFREYWGRYEGDYPLAYAGNETWDNLNVLGIKLLGQFINEYPGMGITPILAENRASVIIDDIRLTLQPDLIADGKGGFEVWDYKTTEKPIPQVWVDNADQFSAYALFMQDAFHAEKIAVVVCNFIKDEARIQWIRSARGRDDIDEYRAKVLNTVYRMEGMVHEKRALYAFDSPCTWCEVAQACTSGTSVSELSLEEFSNQLAKEVSQ